MNSQPQVRSARLLRRISRSSWSTRLLFLLLAGDVVFLVLHLLRVYTPLLSGDGFYLDVDRGYAEWFQYLKYGSMAWLLALVIRRQRVIVNLHWVLLFAYFLVDDAFRIHEKFGVWLAERFELPALFSLRPQDLGELGFFLFVGLFFLTTLVMAYRFSDEPDRRFFQSLILTLPALVFFGIVADMAHQMVSPSALRAWLIVVEDGGEMLVVSIMLWLVFRYAQRTQEWTAGQVHDWVETTATAIILCLIFSAVLGLIQYSTPALAGNDGYYHAKMGLLVRQQGLKPPSPRLPLTILNEADFSDHHLLYHVYLALFARSDPATDGGLGLTQQVKGATVLLAALPFVAIWWLLRQQEVRWAGLWTLALLALSQAFLYRLSMPRAQAASLLVLILGLHWLFQGRYRLLLPLGFVYVWLYDAFPLLLLLAGAYFVAVALSERRLLWPAIIYPAAGILLGLVVNPYFPQNVTFIGRHLIPKLWDASATPVGSEWYPYDTWALMRNSGAALGLYVLTLFLLNWRGKRMEARSLTLFLLTTTFGLMLFRARRFVEYFPPLVLIFAALSLSPLLMNWSEKWQQRRRRLAAGLALLVALGSISTIRSSSLLVAESGPADQYAAAALWLSAYSEPGSTIFQTDWDDFTRLFFYDQDKVYTVGLDPTYMSLHDPQLYAEWVQITRGEVLRPGAAIRERFDADYVFSDLEHEVFLQQATDDPALQEIYRDGYAVIYEVKEAQN